MMKPFFIDWSWRYKSRAGTLLTETSIIIEPGISVTYVTVRYYSQYLGLWKLQKFLQNTNQFWVNGESFFIGWSWRYKSRAGILLTETATIIEPAIALPYVTVCYYSWYLGLSKLQSKSVYHILRLNWPLGKNSSRMPNNSGSTTKPFCLWVDHVNKPIIFVFEAFVSHFKNTISIFRNNFFLFAISELRSELGNPRL